MPGQRQEPCTASRAQPPKALGISLVPGHRRSGYLACRTGTAPGIAAPEEPWEARWIHRRTSDAFTGRRHAGPRAACAAKASPLRQVGTAAVREPTPACSPDRAASTFQRSSVSCEPYRPLLWRGAGRRDRRITLSGQRASPDARWRLTPPVDRFATLALPLQRSGFSFRSSPARVTARRHRPRCHTVATKSPSQPDNSSQNGKRPLRAMVRFTDDASARLLLHGPGRCRRSGPPPGVEGHGGHPARANGPSGGAFRRAPGYMALPLPHTRSRRRGPAERGVHLDLPPEDFRNLAEH